MLAVLNSTQMLVPTGHAALLFKTQEDQINFRAGSRSLVVYWALP